METGRAISSNIWRLSPAINGVLKASENCSASLCFEREENTMTRPVRTSRIIQSKAIILRVNLAMDSFILRFIFYP